MKYFKFKSVVLAMSLSALSNMALAELSTSRAVIKNDGTERITVSANFATPVSGDLYVATLFDGQFLFFSQGGQVFTFDVQPFAENQEYTGKKMLFDFSGAGIPAGYYPIYQLVAKPGSDPFNFNNWVGGLNGLSLINLNIGLATKVNGDFNHDGFADDDKNKDGFHDDDLNHDGFHDDDLNHDGLHDVIINTVAQGKQLFADNCTGCHGTNPAQDRQNIHRATNPDRTRSAINRNKGGMGYLKFLSDTELQSIADYVQSAQ